MAGFVSVDQNGTRTYDPTDFLRSLDEMQKSLETELLKKLTNKFQTVATTGYVGPVSRNENRAAHGGVRHLQARKGKKGLLGRYVNSNGRHEEVGESFDLHPDQLAQWVSMGRCDN